MPIETVDQNPRRPPRNPDSVVPVVVSPRTKKMIQDIISKEVEDIPNLKRTYSSLVTELEDLDTKLNRLEMAFNKHTHKSFLTQININQLKDRLHHVSDRVRSLEQRVLLNSNLLYDQKSTLEEIVVSLFTRISALSFVSSIANETNYWNPSIGKKGATKERILELINESQDRKQDLLLLLGILVDWSYLPLPNPETAGLFGSISKSDSDLPNRAVQNILSPVISMDRSWKFLGHQATAVIRLLCPVAVESVTLDHLIPELCVNMESAPKIFKVKGKREGSDVKDLLIDGTFSEELGSQTFVANHPGEIRYDTIEFIVQENYGHWYTSVHRLRLHGKADEECTSRK
eukprot:TRINITY_DN11570_c0_g1_i1.p1 TRINITY_DN11570_c0_g1~~TRINITY_DN11570_c0_g1_i1.p1  ORF type:complete len:346 (-),score=59.25 TRINITY_DN11570_c0_g1_i1:3-1040(-)